MLANTKRKTLPALGLAALLLLCSGMGCTTAWRFGLPCGGACPLCPLGCCGPRRAPVCVVDPVCYGYHPTWWRPWPEPCVGCPPPFLCVETQIGVLGEAEPTLPETGPFEEVPPQLGEPAPLETVPRRAVDPPFEQEAPVQPEEPAPPPHEAELPPAPHENAPADGDGAASEDQRDEGNPEQSNPSPFRRETTGSGDDQGDSPPKPQRARLWQQEEQPAEVPAEDYSTRKPVTSTLRFVSLFVSAPATPADVSPASHAATGGLPEPKQAVGKDPQEQDPRDATEGDEPLGPSTRERRSVLKALRASFSFPAPQSAAAEATTELKFREPGRP